MHPSQPATSPIRINPYTVESGVSLLDVQVLLFVAVACAIIGILLAEQTTLRRIMSGTDDVLTIFVNRRATETT